MTTKITKTLRFEAAHQLPDHDGKCQRLHGHSYKMEVTVRRNGDGVVREGPKAGMVFDFGDLKAAVASLIEDVLDHHYLNDTIPTEYHPTTAENLCRYVADELMMRLPSSVVVDEVVVHETCTGRASYRPYA